MQRVHIPNSSECDQTGTLLNRLMQVVEQTRRAAEGEYVVWDFSDVTFLHPFFLAPMTATRSHLNSRRSARPADVTTANGTTTLTGSPSQ